MKASRREMMKGWHRRRRMHTSRTTFLVSSGLLRTSGMRLSATCTTPHWERAEAWQHAACHDAQPGAQHASPLSSSNALEQAGDLSTLPYAIKLPRSASQMGGDPHGHEVEV